MSGDAEMMDTKSPPGEEYEEIREQVRFVLSTTCVLISYPNKIRI
jgi:hypothetical protein